MYIYIYICIYIYIYIYIYIFMRLYVFTFLIHLSVFLSISKILVTEIQLLLFDSSFMLTWCDWPPK